MPALQGGEAAMTKINKLPLDLMSRLLAIRDELDAEDERVCAAHLQMVIDTLSERFPELE